MKNFLETAPGNAIGKDKPFQEIESDIKETQEQVISLLKNCDTSELFLNLTKSKVTKIKNLNTLSDLRLHLEKINAGLFSLANSDYSDPSDLSMLSERTKAITLIIEGWSFVKETLRIETPTKIEQTLSKINNRYAN